MRRHTFMYIVPPLSSHQCLSMFHRHSQQQPKFHTKEIKEITATVFFWFDFYVLFFILKCVFLTCLFCAVFLLFVFLSFNLCFVSFDIPSISVLFVYCFFIVIFVDLFFNVFVLFFIF